MSEMVERVARAIAEESGDHSGIIGPHFLGIARAAIAAMRAALAENDPEVWHKMIDEALK